MIPAVRMRSSVIKPTLSKWKESTHIKYVAAGEFHTLYLTNLGQLYSCGSNEVGQLGRQTENSEDKSPAVVETFKGCTISAIACGLQHSMALDEWGQIFSWGSDSMGQLGSNLGAYAQDKPKIIKFLATKNVIQIACGSYHSIALTNNGELYTWGANTHGQCGLGTKSNKETTPQQITSLLGIPIAMIACGSNHTFALSKSGAVFGWGRNMYGQLGLQDVEDRCYPTHLKTLRNVKVCHISCGEDFTAFLTLDGGVFTCGSGLHGQTGHGTTKDELVPRKVMELMGSTVTQVACGRRHLLVRVGERVLACGHGARGQLGCAHAAALVPTPVPFAPRADSPFTPDGFIGPIRVFAGGDHSFLVVSSDKKATVDLRVPDTKMQILTLNMTKLTVCQFFKDNDVVNQDLMAYLETVFGSLACINGSFLLDQNAHFGCNTKVPGVNLKKAEEAFTLISRFENTTLQELIFSLLTEQIIKKVKVSPPDAEALRVFLVLPLYHEMRNPRRHPELQGPFAEAFNKLSSPPQRIVQLWWEAQSAEYFEMLVDIFKSVFVYEMMQPVVRANKVMELMGSTVTQVACGRRHLLVRVGERVLACGHGARGQLGCAHAAALVPTPVPFAPRADSPFTPDGFIGPIRVFAGGDHSFLVVSSDKKATVDLRVPDTKMQILTLNMTKLTACQFFKDNDVVNQDLMAYLETVFGSLACINGSFLLDQNAHFGCNTKVPGVNLKKAEEAFTLISRFENTTLQELIFSLLTEQIIKKVKVSPPDAEALRVFLILPLYHEMRNPRRHPELQGPFAEAFNKLSSPPQRIVQLWWEAQSAEYFEMLVDIFKSVFVYEMMQPVVRANKKICFSKSIVQVLNTLTYLNRINFTNPKKPKIPAECFYVEDLSSHVDIATDYINWLSDQDSTQPHLCNYAFLFDVQCKSLLLKIDQQLQMQMAVNRVATQIFTRLFIDPSYEYQRDQFLILTVSRNHIVRDTMLQISNHDTSQLKKPLRVEFVGEEAEDAGGVKKEFFMLLLKEIFDPVYGMFKQSEETNMIWFSNNPFEDEVMYYLIGAIYGLAIYNSIIIYVPFPLVLYKKILGESVMLDDLSDLYPTLASSLRHLLDYPDDDVEEVFCLCFAVNTEVFDQIQVNPLKENGENIPVTSENKSEYVDLYVDFLLNKSVEKQFKAFNQGFQKVCGGRIIKLFRSHELMSVVIGNEEYDWELFENNCEYENGYSATNQQIRWFWEVFHELSIEDKKKFLLFLTGSDRVPIQGMRDIKIKIQPVADDRYFPVAHTCFNLLDLPRYKTKERLKYHLLQAIQQTQGFSLV
ncbi:unnamed protein product [Euphydryas editha]|uniref:HECT domain-containing protein n=1 Tax=Euphydryas editha TaxID=104508 RepID=A0AAU9V2K8_EUPED|nr:unnamed protein product [Euphydryas editha]